MAHKIKGWLPDLPDRRDILYSAPRIKKAEMPSSIDLTSQSPPVYDQGVLSSCVGNSTCSMYQFVAMKQKLANCKDIPSRLFVYYNARLLEGIESNDAGCQIRDAMKTLAKEGVCEEKYWPYVVNEVNTKPNSAAYEFADHHTTLQYSRLDNTDLSVLKGCLVEGFPFVFGMTLYESFENVPGTGIVSMPGDGEGVVGGHAMKCIGFSDKISCFIVRNSWGENFGDRGNCYIPFKYMTDNSLSDDFWTIRLER